MSDKRDNEGTPEEIEEIKRKLSEVMRSIGRPTDFEAKRRKDVGPYEWDTGE